MADLLEEELAKRLNLYQGFLRLYERNTALIDDLLQSEEKYQSTEKKLTQLYLQGVVDESETYITTNLSTGNTQKLLQPQQIWTIGRDENNGIWITDPYLSHRHGAIQYLPKCRLCINSKVVLQFVGGRFYKSVIAKLLIRKEPSRQN